MLWDVSWNIFRLLADALHLGGMVFGIMAVLTERSVAGFSGKTQILYQLVYVSRYLDVFTSSQGIYLLFFKVTFNLITALMIASFFAFQKSYDASADSCNISAIVACSASAAFLTSYDAEFEHLMWTFSEFLEPLALVPQYIACYRTSRMRGAVIFYVLLVGGYRSLYVCNWIYKRYMWSEAYHDYISWIGGLLECVLFADFVLRISARKDVVGAIETSWLGKLLLHTDESVGRFLEGIELKALGRRLPYRVSDAHSDGCELNAGDRRPLTHGLVLQSYS